jgi:hypothetical protein
MMAAVPPSAPTSMQRPWWHALTDLVHGRIATTASGVERAFSLLVVGIRLGTLLTMAPSLAPGVAVSPRPGLYLASWIVAAAAAIAISVLALVRQGPLGRGLFVADVLLAVVLLLLGGLCVPTDQRIGTWIGFQPGNALGALLSGALVRGLGLWLAGLAVVVVADVAFRWPQVSSVNASTVIGNVLTYVVLVSVSRVVTAYMRRVAADGDAARAEAAALARRDEERRAQIALHNGAALMRLLADPDLDDDVRRAVRQEAEREAHRMRSYLLGRSPDLDGDDGEDRHLVSVVRATTARFSDLPLHAAVDLADGVRVDGAVAAALDHALAALLLNVRDHAGASRVVVHADAEATPDGPRWTVTVHDDGRGFDADRATWGVGLREVVHAQLTELGVDVAITSRPGHGSTAVLIGPGVRVESVRAG